MDLFDLSAIIRLDTNEYERSIKTASGKFAKLGNALKAGVGVAAKATAAAVGVAAAGVSTIVKGAVDAYADYEQLVGGVETLFGGANEAIDKYSDSVYELGQQGQDVIELQKELIAQGYDIGESGADGIYGPATQAAFEAYKKAAHETGNIMADAADIVKGNAERAWETAGLSANEYMETVTSFSASLLQSLGRDTLAAAQYADMAITDMSDNANKMGTSMEAIQNAYQGFAKQNYTMLDNLKLGYGGTKTEMERLLEDAEKIKASQGEMADYSIDSYADIVEAIHVVQTEMGITGTTAEEASKTISGSWNATKAAWKNLLVAFGSGQDVKKAMSNLVSSAKNVVKNVMPVVKNALAGIGDFVKEIGPIIIEQLPGLVQELLPGLLSAAISLVGSLAKALPGIMKAVFVTLKDIFGTLLETLSPIAKDLGIRIINGIVDGIKSLLNAIWSWGSAVITQFIDGVASVWGSLKSTGAELITQIGNGVLSLWGSVKAWGSAVVSQIKSGITSMFSTLVTAGGDLLTQIGNGIIARWEAVKAWGTAIIDQIKGGIESMFDNIKTTGSDIIAKVGEGITGALSSAWSWGSDLISNFTSGIVAKWNELKSTVSEVAGSIASFLHFSEPDEGPLADFHTYAPDMMALFAQGIRDNEHLVTDQLAKSFDFRNKIFGAQDFSAPYSYGRTINGRSAGADSSNIEDRLDQVIDLLEDIVSNGLNANISKTQLYKTMSDENRKRTKATNYNAFAMA